MANVVSCAVIANETVLKPCVAMNMTCGASRTAPTATVIHGAAERKYGARRGSVSAPSASPASMMIDQYLPSMAAAAPAPASAAQAGRRVSNESRNHHAVTAQNGVRIELALYLRARKL